MIITNLKGGLGNQMFQYALGLKLAKLHAAELVLDTDGLERANITGDIYRPFSLQHFALSARMVTPEERQRFKYPYGALSKGWRYVSFHLLKQTNIVFNEAVLRWPNNSYVDGYWQSPKYFEDIRADILGEYVLREPYPAAGAAYADQIRTSTAVGVHIRRGDYVKNPRVLQEFGICSEAYYTAAIKRIQTEVHNPTFFVFSDDIEWVKQHLPVPTNTVYVQHPDLLDTHELMLMSECTHNIIANSTFSWWAAWLNQHPDKIIIAPRPWYESQPWDPDLIPPTWIQLPKT